MTQSGHRSRPITILQRSWILTVPHSDFSHFSWMRDRNPRPYHASSPHYKLFLARQAGAQTQSQLRSRRPPPGNLPEIRILGSWILMRSVMTPPSWGCVCRGGLAYVCSVQRMTGAFPKPEDWAVLGRGEACAPGSLTQPLLLLFHFRNSNLWPIWLTSKLSFVSRSASSEVRWPRTCIPVFTGNGRGHLLRGAPVKPGKSFSGSVVGAGEQQRREALPLRAGGPLRKDQDSGEKELRKGSFQVLSPYGKKKLKAGT